MVSLSKTAVLGWPGADTVFLCDKAALLGDAIKRILYTYSVIEDDLPSGDTTTSLRRQAVVTCNKTTELASLRVPQITH